MADFEGAGASGVEIVTELNRRFTAGDGASAHCQSDNIRLSAQVTFDWLDERLA